MTTRDLSDAAHCSGPSCPGCCARVDVLEATNAELLKIVETLQDSMVDARNELATTNHDVERRLRALLRVGGATEGK